MTRTKIPLPDGRGSEGRDPSRDNSNPSRDRKGAVLLMLALLAAPAFSQTSDLAPVVSKLLSRTADLPGEFQPFLMVSLHARVAGYVEKVLVDRGSAVKQGQLLAELSAPEMAARITDDDRLVHPGALVGPGADPVLLVIQQVSRLRLIVAVPEQDIAGIVAGAKVEFKVPAFPERTYAGAVARVAHALDLKTRTMPVELDVLNRDGSLSPGMYPSVKWPIRRARPSLLVPKTSVVTTAERTFVVRGRNGKAEWVDVKKGAADGDNIEVMGNLEAGDKVVPYATLRPQIPIDSFGRLAALRDGPHHQRLSAAYVAGGEHAGDARHI